MTDDRRTVPRARLSGVRATYEGALGERGEAEVFDLGRGGLFLRSESPLPVGKRLSLEIQVTGEESSWPALARVVWTRPNDDGPDHPRGMAVKLIDVDDAIADALQRLAQTREPTDRGVGLAPARERTILGVGAAPVAEPSLVIGLVAKKGEAEAAAASNGTHLRGPANDGAPIADGSPPPPRVAGPPADEGGIVGRELAPVERRRAFERSTDDAASPSGAPRAARRGSTAGRLFGALLLVAVAAAAAYAFRDRIDLRSLFP